MMVDVIRETILEMIVNSKQMKLCYGIVTSIEPLVVEINSNLSISENALVLTKNVMDYVTKTGNVNDEEGRNSLKIFNGLEVDEKVIMLSAEEGDKYIVLDKL